MQTHSLVDLVTVKFTTNDRGNPAGKLADVELHFVGDSVFAGLKLIGFSVWERRGGGRNVTFPARQYSVNGERRSFALLRPIADATAQHALRDRILDAYAEYETANGSADAADGIHSSAAARSGARTYILRLSACRSTAR